MTIRALSASQAERFDPEQVGGCKRRWYFQNVMRLDVPEPEASKEDGHAGHVLFAMHYRGEALPKRHLMLKAVRGAIAKGDLPAREPGQLVESRFDGQPARDADGERVHLDTARTLWLGGVPWDGYVDLRFYRAGMITVLDFKFSSDIHAYAKPADSLINTVQMPVYALDSLRLWPEAQHVELIHYYVSRKGVDSFKRRQLVSTERIRQRGREIERIVADMRAVSEAKSPDDVPGNRKSCNTWSGCPFQSRCSAFKEKPKMDLNPEESEWLNALGGGPVETLKAASDVIAKAEPAVLAAAVENLTGDEKAKLAEFVKPPATGPEADAATELEIASAAGALSADDDPFAVFAPKPSVPQEQPAKPPACPDCSTELNAENGSERDGKWIHVACPAKSATPAATGPKCPACPHPAHDGAACSGKRGRGACKCAGSSLGEQFDSAVSAAAAQPLIADLRSAITGHLPACVENDAGKWLCMEGCTAAVVASLDAEQEFNGLVAQARADARGAVPLTVDTASCNTTISGNVDPTPSGDPNVAALQREREMHRRTLGELDASERELKRLRNLQRPEGAPIPMLLWCPACHARHVDSGEHATKPHHTHACQSCGLAWRPAVVATVGVQFLPGFKND